MNVLLRYSWIYKDSQFIKYVLDTVGFSPLGADNPFSKLLHTAAYNALPDIQSYLKKNVFDLQPSLIAYALKHRLCDPLEIIASTFDMLRQRTYSDLGPAERKFFESYIEGVIEFENPPSSLDFWHQNIPWHISRTLQVLVSPGLAVKAAKIILAKPDLLTSPHLQFMLKQLLGTLRRDQIEALKLSTWARDVRCPQGIRDFINEKNRSIISSPSNQTSWEFNGRFFTEVISN